MNTLLIAIIVIGTASFAMMRREVFPEFELEILLVSVPYPGASPEDVAEGICQKIEEAVQPVDDIKKITAVAQENAGFVVLELQADADVQRTLNEVRSELDQIAGNLPDLAEDHDVQQLTFRFPALRIGLLGPEANGEESEVALRNLAEEIRNDILHLEPEPPSGIFSTIISKLKPRSRKSVVSSAKIIGEKPYQIDIEISERTLREYGLSLKQVANIVRLQNIELPGGRMKTDAQEMLLVGKNKRTVGTEIEDIVIRALPHGDKITVGQLGNVSDGFADETRITRINGQPGLVIQVERTSSEDLYEVVESVLKYVEEKESLMPPGYSLETWYDQSVDVRDRMNMLLRNGLQGLVLVFLVLAIFLELRLAFWVALGIPIAVLGAGTVLLNGDQTLNMLSMFAFLMALGIVVDDAIVIGENIYQHRHLGKSFYQAAVDGTVEVFPSVTASVTTTIIAFAPLMFVAGVMGKFIGVMPVAVIAMLVISLGESMLILPCHLSHRDNLFFWVVGLLLYPLKFLIDVFAWLNKATTVLIQWTVERAYIPFLAWSMRNPAITLSAAAALLIVAFGFVRAGITPFVVFPKLDSRFIEAAITFPNGTPSEVTDNATRHLETVMEDIIAEYNKDNDVENNPAKEPLVVVRHRSVGLMLEQNPRNPTSTAGGSHLGTVMAELCSPSFRELTSQEVLDRWRQRAGDFPGAESVLFRSPSFGPAGISIEFKLLANPGFEDQLPAAAELCKQQLAKYKGVFDIDDDLTPGKWELQMKVKDNAKGMSVTLADLAETVRSSYYGEEVMRLQRGRHEVKLMVRFPPEERKSLAGFEEIRVRGSGVIERPVTEVAEVTYDRGTSEINRINQLRSVTIMADVDKLTAKANANRITSDLRKEDGFFETEFAEQFPGIRVLWEGQQEQTRESLQSLFTGFIIALLAMYVLLTVEFRSYLQPVIILAIIPFGAIGAIAGHAVMGLDLTLFSVFGLVALTGVVVNDSIVLIDFINTRVRDGVPLEEALLDAGRRRFRAVMLTSVTTIAGLIPLLLETSFQAQVLIPMATSLCFGLALATALILILVPTFYYVYVRVIQRLTPKLDEGIPADAAVH